MIGPADEPRPRIAGAFDVLVYGNVWVALAALLLTAAAARAMGTRARPEALVLAFAGTLAVYGLDRLADAGRDRRTAPARTAFVVRHAAALRAATALAAVVAVAAGIAAGPRVVALAAFVLGVGLAHRWIKQVPFGKAVYIAGAWTAVVAGVPWLQDPSARHAAGVALVLGTTLAANVAASSARDAEAGARVLGPARLVVLGRLLALVSLALALRAPLVPLLPVPLCTLVVLLAWRPGERYGLVAVDGALVVGAAIALAL